MVSSIPWPLSNICFLLDIIISVAHGSHFSPFLSSFFNLKSNSKIRSKRTQKWSEDEKQPQWLFFIFVSLFDSFFVFLFRCCFKLRIRHGSHTDSRYRSIYHHCNVRYTCTNRMFEFSVVRRAARVPQRASVVGWRSPRGDAETGEW